MSIPSFPDRDPWGDKAYRGNCSGHNERNATKPGGIYGTLTGDIRRGERYVSLQAEFIARMPRDELKAILIKTQHNTQSRNKSYGKMRFPLIQHEYAPTEHLESNPHWQAKVRQVLQRHKDVTSRERGIWGLA